MNKRDYWLADSKSTTTLARRREADARLVEQSGRRCSEAVAETQPRQYAKAFAQQRSVQ
jgi:hypothetical protein